MKIKFLLLFLLVSIIGQSQVLKTINVETAGSLSILLTEEEKIAITDLTVTGSIDARDIKCMRDQIANLTNLDLRNANIAAFDGIATTSVSNSYPVNEMPKFSFYNGTSAKAKKMLVSIILPSSLTSIGQNAFYLCENIKSIYIGNSITNIGIESFKGCYGLTTVIMGNSVTTIQQEAFHYCSSLKNITLSENINYIGNDAFSSCIIDKVVFPNSMTTISNAFRSCTYLTEVTLPASITNISNWAFEYCNGLNSIYSLNTIPPVCEAYSFYLVPNITSVYVPASSVNAYKSAPVWGDNFYSVIKAIQITNVEETKMDGIKIYSLNSNIIIDRTSKGEIVRVFTLMGQLLNKIESSGDKIVISNLKNNIYLVKTATRTFKVLIQE